MKKVLLSSLFLLISSLSIAQVTISTDSRSNYTDWTNGSNLGTGFGTWTLSSSDGGGSYLGNTGLPDPSMEETDNSFGIYSSATGSFTARRDFNSQLDIGQSFQIEIGHTGIADGGQIGLNFYSSSNFRLNFKFIGGEAQYKLNDGGSDYFIALNYSGGNTITFTLTRGTGNNYSLTISDGTQTFNAVNYVATSGSFSIDRVDIYTTNQGAGENLGFNNLTVSDPGTQDLAAYRGFRLLASPVTATFATFLTPIWTQGATGADTENGSSNVWTWNNSAAGFATENWVANTDLTASSLSGASGLLAYDYDNDDFAGGQDNAITTLSVTGSEKAAPGEVALNENELGYSLIGNPFASAIDWSLITKSNVEATAHVWNPTGNDAGSWEAITGTDKIAAFQGFLVRTTAAGAASVTIDNSSKTTGATFLGKEASTYGFKIGFESGSFVKNLRFVLNDEASISQDRFDAERLLPLATNYLDAYFDVNDKAFTINALPVLTSQVSIPLFVEFTQSGSVTLTAKNFNLPNGFEAILVDNLTNTSHPISADFSYQFEHVVANKAIAQNPLDVMKKNLLPGVTSKEARFNLVVGPITTSVQEVSTIPTAVKLNQNYPNPFNPSTQISFEVPQAMQVSLTVFDMLGREVATLVNATVNAGLTTTTWNASNVGSGLYYYRLQAGSTVMTKKMLLVK